MYSGVEINLTALRGGDDKFIQLCKLLPAVAEGRSVEHTLSSLNLLGNELSDESGKALAEVLPLLTKLQELNVEGNNLSVEVKAAIEEVAPERCHKLYV